MSAIAEPLTHAHIDDRLARRNAMVLAVAQALAGGNNTVIVSTASIVGAVLAPDKGLATLPITAMVIGMWFGTLPVGALARRFGRRFALQTGSVFGVLSGLISYAAVMNGQFWLLLIGTFCGGPDCRRYGRERVARRWPTWCDSRENRALFSGDCRISLLPATQGWDAFVRSFPRKRESSSSARCCGTWTPACAGVSGKFGKAHPHPLIPAQAGIQLFTGQPRSTNPANQDSFSQSPQVSRPYSISSFGVRA